MSSVIKQSDLLSEPKKIYQIVAQKVDDIIETIDKNNTPENHSEKFGTSKEMLYEEKKKIEKELAEISANAEWNELTIAFYGETGAGKSTIIDTLRILLKEKTKIEAQQKFKQLEQKNQKSYEEKLNLINQKKEKQNVLDEYNQKNQLIENQINQINQEKEDKANEIKKSYQDKNDAIQVEFENSSLELNEEKKYLIEQRSFISKYLLFFMKAPGVKEIDLQLSELNRTYRIQKGKLEAEINRAVLLKTQNYDYRVQDLQSKIDSSLRQQKEVRDSYQKIELELQNIESKLKKDEDLMRSLQDGEIIGYGNSDHTKVVTAFEINVNGINVQILDVPGIEGDEKIVIDEINKAVQKAHIIFFVTAKDAPPQEGTLEKIKMHLSAQTEVYSIYNKPATNPRNLLNPINENDEKVLKEIDNTMMAALGDQNYKGHIIVFGLAAFYSQADCFLPGEKHYNGRQKFLDKFDKLLLISKSNLDKFQSLLMKEVLTADYKKKIRINNFNKAEQALNQVNQVFLNVSEELQKLSSNIQGNLNVANKELDNELRNTKSLLSNNVDEVLSYFSGKVREDVEDEINKNISNSDFKQQLELNMEYYANKLPAMFQEKFDATLEQFNHNCTEITQELESRLERLVDGYQNLFSKDYNLKIDFSSMKSGLSKMGLLGVAIGAVATMWWNPVGWVAITAVVAGLVISFVKSIWGFFSDDYKMSQQRETLSKNISNARKNIKEQAEKELEKVNSSLDDSMCQLEEQLEAPKKRTDTIINEIQHIYFDLKQLSTEINRIKGI